MGGWVAEGAYPESASTTVDERGTITQCVRVVGVENPRAADVWEVQRRMEDLAFDER